LWHSNAGEAYQARFLVAKGTYYCGGCPLRGVCPRCGEKFVKSDVGQLILKLKENSERIVKFIFVVLFLLFYTPL